MNTEMKEFASKKQNFIYFKICSKLRSQLNYGFEFGLKKKKTVINPPDCLCQ